MFERGGDGRLPHAGRIHVTVTVGDDLANDGEAGEGDNVSSETIGVDGGEGNDTMTSSTRPPSSKGPELKGGDGSRSPVDPALPVRGLHLRGRWARHDPQGGEGTGSFTARTATISSSAAKGTRPSKEKGATTRCEDSGARTTSSGTAAPTCSSGPGRDSVAGGHGPDTIFARDGQRDSLAVARARKTARESTEGSTRSMTWRSSFDASVLYHRGGVLRPRLGRCGAGGDGVRLRRRRHLRGGLERGEPGCGRVRGGPRPRGAGRRHRRDADSRSRLQLGRWPRGVLPDSNLGRSFWRWTTRTTGRNVCRSGRAGRPTRGRRRRRHARFRRQPKRGRRTAGRGADSLSGEGATVDYLARGPIR